MVELVPVSSPTAAAAAGSEFDAVVAVGPLTGFDDVPSVAAHLQAASQVDAQAAKLVALHDAPDLAGGRLVFAPTSSLDRDIDDVRRFADAAAKGLQRARDAGAVKPLLLVGGVPEAPAFANAHQAALLGALSGLWQPLEAREARGEAEMEPVQAIGFFAAKNADKTRAWVLAVEAGRRLTRDLGGTEPERMAPPRFAEMCELAFAGTDVKVEIVSDRATLEKDYPLLMAVARCSMTVKRHHPRVVRLEYTGDGPIERTLLFSGKGVTYDTGGADIKAGGHMAGMSRDKCGGAAVAGFVKTVAELAPKNLRVIAEIGVVRNSVGSEAFVSDEILTSHAGVRVRIGNTDAEGRLVLADCLSHLRQRALKETNPLLFTCATLTGHAALSAGPYSIAMENGPARALGLATKLSQAGDAWGDCFEISRSRREDFDFITGKSTAQDILSCNNAPSSRTPRGHQFPMAFLVLAAGLADHGSSSKKPLPFTHLDVAGSATSGDWQHGVPTAAPVLALTAAFVE